MQQHPHHHSYDPLHLFEGEDEQQMSEAFRNSAFLALSGGFQDAYTYNVRNEVFSNAQTGNVVLMSQHLMAGEWMSGLRYLLPLISFALGVWVAERSRENTGMRGSFTGGRVSFWQRSFFSLSSVSCRENWICWPRSWCPLPVPCRCRVSVRFTAIPMPVRCVSET